MLDCSRHQVAMSAVTVQFGQDVMYAAKPFMVFLDAIVRMSLIKSSS